MVKTLADEFRGKPRIMFSKFSCTNTHTHTHTQVNVSPAHKNIFSVITEAISPSALVQPPCPVTHCNLILFQFAAKSHPARTRCHFKSRPTQEFIKITQSSSTLSHSKNKIPARAHRQEANSFSRSPSVFVAKHSIS